MPMTQTIYYNISNRFIPRGSAKPVVNFNRSMRRGISVRAWFSSSIATSSPPGS
jgi:hypothetical protein